MTKLFQRTDGTSMPFHLAELPEHLFQKFKNMIEINGGKVEPNPKENVLTFTTPINAYNYKFVFNVKFIEDCVVFNRILDFQNYFLGDSRINNGCEMPNLIGHSNTCLFFRLGILNSKKESNPPIQTQNIRKAQKRKLESNSNSSPIEISSAKTMEKTKNVSIEEICDSNTNRRIDSVKSKHIQSMKFINSALHKGTGETDFMSNQIQKRMLESNFSPVTKIPAITMKETTSVPNEEFHSDLNTNKRINSVTRNRTETTKSVNSLSEEETSEIDMFKSDSEDSKSSIFCDSNDEVAIIGKSLRVSRLRLKKIKKVLTPEVSQWIENVNKDKPKDKYGYPKLIHRSYTPWESRNILDFVIKTNTLHMVNHTAYWKDVYKLKLLPRTRIWKSLYKHFNEKILPRIDQFHVDKNIEEEFTNYHKNQKAQKELKLEQLRKKKISKISNTNK